MTSRPRCIVLVLTLSLASLVGCGDDDGDPGDVIRFRAVTFNTGSGGPTGSYSGGEFTSDLKTIADDLYGNGLAWVPAVETTRQWIAEVDPDIIVFQEIFYTEDCSDIPTADREHFICEEWQPGDDTVAQVILGAGYQVMCHFGHPDKCGAVKTRFGSFEECAEDFCVDGMGGGRVPDCGRGSRVGRGTIDLVEGGTLTLVNFHGSSGVTSEDEACRVQQVNQVFVDLLEGDGQPAANGERNLILGDFNADPVLWASFDDSAARWLDFATNPDDPEHTADRPFHFISDVGEAAEPSYAALYNIDHVLSDVASGECWVAGITPDHPYVLSDDLYFDHKPVVCDLEMPAP